jgi:hypothetical protein
MTTKALKEFNFWLNVTEVKIGKGGFVFICRFEHPKVPLYFARKRTA